MITLSVDFIKLYTFNDKTFKIFIQIFVTFVATIWLKFKNF